MINKGGVCTLLTFPCKSDVYILRIEKFTKDDENYSTHICSVIRPIMQ